MTARREALTTRQTVRRTDFDPATGTLTITKSLAELNGKLWVKDVLTKNGWLRVPLAFSLGVVKEHRGRMRAARATTCAAGSSSAARGPTRTAFASG